MLARQGVLHPDEFLQMRHGHSGGALQISPVSKSLLVFIRFRITFITLYFIIRYLKFIINVSITFNAITYTNRVRFRTSIFSLLRRGRGGVQILLVVFQG